MKQKINFITDVVNGQSLSITSTDRGWVEYAKEIYKIYATKSFPEDLYKNRHGYFIEEYRKFGIDLLPNIGFVSHLERVLSEKGFLLPVFGEMDKGAFNLSCGNSRFLAHMSSGKELSDLGLVIFSKDKLERNDLVEITSTQQFIEFYNLADIDFAIGMNREDQDIRVKYSSLRHTFYNEVNPDRNGIVLKTQQDITNFWERFQSEDGKKFMIKIHCLPEHRALVNQSPFFNIKFIDEDPKSWGFSFGRLLGAFRHDENNKSIHSPEITLWLFGPTEKIDLEPFIPLVHANCPCVYTKNQKAVMFNSNAYSDFRICGDIVK